MLTLKIRNLNGEIEEVKIDKNESFEALEGQQFFFNDFADAYSLSLSEDGKTIRVAFQLGLETIHISFRNLATFVQEDENFSALMVINYQHQESADKIIQNKAFDNQEVLKELKQLIASSDSENSNIASNGFIVDDFSSLVNLLQMTEAGEEDAPVKKSDIPVFVDNRVLEEQELQEELRLQEKLKKQTSSDSQTDIVEPNEEKEVEKEETSNENRLPIVRITSIDLPSHVSMGDLVATVFTADSDGDKLIFGLSNTQNYYQLNASNNGIELTQVGADHKNAGNDLPNFTLFVGDGKITIAVSVNLSVDLNHTVTILEDTTHKLSLSDFSSSNAILKVQITTLPMAGNLQYKGSDVTLNQEISKADIDAGYLHFTPAPNGHGDTYATFDFKVADSSGAYSNSAKTITYNVTNVNDAPEGSDITLTINEDTPTALSVANFGFTDVDTGNALSKIQITTLETVGKLEYYNGNSWVDVIVNQEIVKADIDAGYLRFTPVQNAHGNAYTTFDFKVADGSGIYSSASNRVTYNVMAVDDALSLTVTPVGTLTEDSVTTATVVATSSASDEDGGNITYSLASNPDSYYVIDGTTGEVKLTQAGVDFVNQGNSLPDFQVKAESTTGSVSEETKTVNLVDTTPVNDAPTANADTVSFSTNAVLEREVTFDTGTITTGTTGTDNNGKVAQAASFGGSNKDGAVVKVEALNLDKSNSATTTINLWFKDEDIKGYSEVLLSSGNLEFVSNSGKFGFGTDKNDVYGFDATQFHDGQWHQLTMVIMNGNLTQNKIYVDGQLQTLSHINNIQLYDYSSLTGNSDHKGMNGQPQLSMGALLGVGGTTFSLSSTTYYQMSADNSKVLLTQAGADHLNAGNTLPVVTVTVSDGSTTVTNTIGPVSKQVGSPNLSAGMTINEFASEGSQNIGSLNNGADATKQDLVLGANKNDDRPYTGSLDEMKIYKGELTSADIAQLYALESSGKAYNSDGHAYSENSKILIDVLRNDADEEGQPLSIDQIQGQAVVNNGAAVNVTNNDGEIIGTAKVVDQKIEFTPDQTYFDALEYGQSQDVSFEYRANDGSGGVATAVVGFKIAGMYEILDLDGNVDLSTIDRTQYNNLDVIDLTNNVGNQTITVNRDDLLSLVDDDKQLVFIGDNEDKIDLDLSDWTKQETKTTIDGIGGNFVQYINKTDSNLSIFLEESDISVI